MNHQHTSKLKVCGLTKLNQIQELISMKVDFLGFIFYEKSPRYVLNHLTLDDISKIDHPGKQEYLLILPLKRSWKLLKRHSLISSNCMVMKIMISLLN